MEVVATGTLTGHEARAKVRVRQDESTATIELADLWVAPGAPDVRLFVSSHADGTVDEASTDLGRVPDGTPAGSWDVPTTLEADTARAVVIYCHVYSVLFGFAELEWISAGPD